MMDSVVLWAAMMLLVLTLLLAWMLAVLLTSEPRQLRTCTRWDLSSCSSCRAATTQTCPSSASLPRSRAHRLSSIPGCLKTAPGSLPLLKRLSVLGFQPHTQKACLQLYPRTSFSFTALLPLTHSLALAHALDIYAWMCALRQMKRCHRHQLHARASTYARAIRYM